MPEQPKKQPTFTSVEGDLFGGLFGFYQKAMTLLRQSSLNEEKLKVVAGRINTLLDNATAELKRTKQLNLTEQLEAAFDEVKRLVDELSGCPDGGNDG